MSDRSGSEPSPWERAALAASLLAVDPNGCGGAVLRGAAGPARDRWLALVRELSPAGTPFRRIPPRIAADRLLGGLDLAATLRTGKRVAQQGLLAEAHQGFAVLAMAERVEPGVAAQIALAREAGEVILAREGVTARTSSNFALIALDEGIDDEAIAASLRDGLAFHLDLEGIRAAETGWRWHTAADVAEARVRLPRVEADETVIVALCDTAVALGIGSHRAELLALRVARAAAALDGRSRVNTDDVVLAGRLVLAPRATAVALPPDDAQEPQADTPPEEATSRETASDSTRKASDETRPLEDVVLEAVRAAIPEGLLARLQALASRGAVSRRTGRSGDERRSTLRGRPAGTRAGRPGAAGRLSVIDTLRAAAPWQRLRKPVTNQSGTSLAFHPEDFRIRRFKARTETTTIFAVDASGSAALHRLAEAKGAVELLLADCYVRRDRVAVVAFRGRRAELLLPPTRSLARAKRGLAGLPGGGGTPLASALDLARQLADAVARRGGTASLVVLTDGQANVARDGSGGRQRAGDEARQAARLLRATGTRSVVVDTASRPQALARQLADDMGARYVPLPHAGARAISEVARRSS